MEFSQEEITLNHMGHIYKALATGGPNSSGYVVFIRTGAQGPGGAALAASAHSTPFKAVQDV